LRDNIREFSEVKNLIAHAKHSNDLKNALESGKKIIITTIQKFRFIVEEVDDLRDRRFAIIIDEAHSSQSGRSADTLNIAINKDEEEEIEDNQDKILEVMEGRKLCSVTFRNKKIDLLYELGGNEKKKRESKSQA